MALEGLLTAGCSNREAQGAPRMSSDVTGDVRDVKAWLLESVPKVTVTVEFVNHSGRPVAVDSFRLVWPPYEQVEKDAGVVIPANQSTTKVVDIVTAHPPEPTTTRVEILVARVPSIRETPR
jgi:hypothetical protein